MADITPIASLNGELAMPEKVWMQGPPGPQGPKGDPGPAGAGVPAGGTVGQLLGKTETGNAWIDPPQSGGGITTLHINVTAVNKETMEATFTADKTPVEMQQASANGPTWCVVSFAAGVMAAEAISLGVPPAWSASIPAFGDAFMEYHDDNGYNIHTYAVLADYPNSWILNLGVFRS